MSSQPDDKRLMPAGRVGELALLQELTQHNHRHRQRLGADIDTTKYACLLGMG